MAIDKIGGEYIIKGNNTDSRLTSAGQSWANLLTSEKYKLWQVANQEAMRQLQTEQMNAQQRQQKVNQLRDDLLRQRNATIKGVEDLKNKQLTAIGASNTATWKAQTERNKPRAVRSSSGSSSGRSGGRNKYGSLLEYTNELTSTYQDIYNQFKDIEKNIPTEVVTTAAYRNMQFQNLTPAEQQKLDDWSNETGIPKEQIIIQRQQLGALQTEISRIQETETKNEKETLQKINDSFRADGGLGSGSGGSVTTYTKGKPVTQSPVIDYSGQVKTLEDRLKQTEEKLLELENVDIPSGNGINRTRKVMRDQFGIGNYQEQEAESPVIPTEPVVSEPVVAQPEVQSTQETTDELMSQKNAEAYLDNLFASRLTQPQPQPQPQVLPQSQVQQPQVQQPRITPPSNGLATPDRLPLTQEQTAVEEILELNQPENTIDNVSSIDKINQIKLPNVYGDMNIDGVSVVSDAEDQFRLEQFTPEMAVTTLNNIANRALNQEGSTTESVGDAIQITALQLLNQNSKFRLSDPEKYDKYKEEILDYVFQFLQPEKASTFRVAKEIVASKNLDEMGLYKYVEGATSEDNKNLLSILQTNWGSLNNASQVIEQSQEAKKALDSAYNNSSITYDKYQKYINILDIWTMVGEQIIEETIPKQELILDKFFTPINLSELPPRTYQPRGQ